MISTRKLLTVAFAAAALTTGSLAMTGQASAGFKGGHGFHAGHNWHGGHHKWHGHRWGHRFFGGYNYVNYSPCYWVKKHYGVIKVCPSPSYY
jgi:hypothetical protein